MATQLPLEGLYLHLVRSGFPISTRDFQDALTALELGHGALDRERLHWLCDTLWVRTDEEKVRLERLFREFPQPTAETVESLTGAAGRSRSKTKKLKPKNLERVEEASPRISAPAVQFVSAQEAGVGLRRANLPVDAAETFILTPRLPVSLRSLVVILRRFRLAKRFGPRTELDIDATVAEQGRRGTLVEPVLVPARRNQARLIVAVDASPSMTPWKRFQPVLIESLERSHLGHSALYYFSNVPRGALFESDRLLRPLAMIDAAKRHGACALLVVSDAGAARGASNRVRAQQTEVFLSAGAAAAWWPVAWVNPMPSRRWQRTTADRIAALPGLRMFELTEDGLVQAVDFLRGKHSG